MGLGGSIGDGSRTASAHPGVGDVLLEVLGHPAAAPASGLLLPWLCSPLPAPQIVAELFIFSGCGRIRAQPPQLTQPLPASLVGWERRPRSLLGVGTVVSPLVRTELGSPGDTAGSPLIPM